MVEVLRPIGRVWRCVMEALGSFTLTGNEGKDIPAFKASASGLLEITSFASSENFGESEAGTWEWGVLVLESDLTPSGVSDTLAEEGKYCASPYDLMAIFQGCGVAALQEGPLVALAVTFQAEGDAFHSVFFADIVEEVGPSYKSQAALEIWPAGTRTLWVQEKKS